VPPISGLSVIVITKNEEADIDACLASVADIASEIVVVDAHSTDRTRDIARARGATILEREWNGFGPQKQFALENARGPWVLNIDADERLTPTLASDIRAALSGENAGRDEAAFDIAFHHYFLGRRLRFGGGQGEHHVRLFRKDRASYGGTRFHEGIHVQGPVARIESPIAHYSYRSIREYLDKCNRYTTLIAEDKYARGVRLSWKHHFRLPYEFFVRYVLRLGFLDGGPGLVYAALSSYYVWLKYVKLLDMTTDRGERP
jgi:glycosyltransferase involved in cell wall biosynthesis